MPHFKDDREVYSALGRLFQDLLADESVAGQLRRVDAIVQWQYRDPGAAITTKLVADEPFELALGATNLRPAVIVAMTSDTGHEFWLGQVNITVALSQGVIKAKGPVATILKLVPLVKLVAPRYQAQLEGGGATQDAPLDEAAEDVTEPEVATEGTAAGETAAEGTAGEGTAAEAEQPAAEEPADQSS